MNKILILALILCLASLDARAIKKKNLNLSSKGLTNVSFLEVPKRIRILNLSFNAITSLEGLVLPEKLNRLDLDFNSLTTLDGFEANKFLKVLEIGSNPNISDYSKLQELNQIKSLALSLNLLDNKNFDINLMNPDLEELAIGGNKFKTLDLSQFSKLQVLRMKGMFPISRGFDEFLLDYSKVVLPENLKEFSVCSLGYKNDFTGLVLPDNLKS